MPTGVAMKHDPDKPHNRRSRAVLLLALGPAAVATPAAAAAIGTHASDAAKPPIWPTPPAAGAFTIGIPGIGQLGAGGAAVPVDPTAGTLTPSPTPTSSEASGDQGAEGTDSPTPGAGALTPTPVPDGYTVTITPTPKPGAGAASSSPFVSPELNAQLQRAREQITALVVNALRSAAAARATGSSVPTPSPSGATTPAEATPTSSTSPSTSTTSSSTPGDGLR